MIIDITTKMKWTSNKKYYTDKGYVFTKMYEEFDVKIEDLYIESNRKIKVMCDICGEEKILSYRKYNQNINHCNYYACSRKCSINKNKETNLKKYGNENYYNVEKYKETCLDKYGVDNVSKIEDIKNKKIETCLKNYGVEYPGQSEEIQEKSKQTCIEKYGYEYPWLNVEVKNKVNKTMIERYGVKNPSQNKDIMKRTIQTQIDRYGEMWKNHIPRYNPNSIIYLDMISEKLNVHIQHALNGGEKKLLKYWIDGYIDKYNICIEWDEKDHKNTKEYDEIREQFLIENRNCKFVRIDEDVFLKNINDSIFNIITEIKLLM